MSASVIQISVKPETPGEVGLPKMSVDQALVKKEGLEGDYNRARKKKKDNDYFSSPFEIDAYSSELAFDMFLYNKEEKTCDSYARYATIDNKIANKMRSQARKKYSYLKNNK